MSKTKKIFETIGGLLFLAWLAGVAWFAHVAF